MWHPRLSNQMPSNFLSSLLNFFQAAEIVVFFKQNLFYLSRTNTQALRTKPSIFCYLLKEVFVKFACGEKGGWGWKMLPRSEAFLLTYLHRTDRTGLDSSLLSCLQSCFCVRWRDQTHSVARPDCLFTKFSKGLSTTSPGQTGEKIRGFFRTVTAFQHPKGGITDVFLSRPSRDGFWSKLHLWAVCTCSVHGMKMTSAQDVLIITCIFILFHLTSEIVFVGKKLPSCLGPLLNCSCWLQSIKQFWLKYNQNSG